MSFSDNALDHRPNLKNLKAIGKEEDFVFQALAYMGDASHYMAWANTVIEHVNVPETLKTEMKSINDKLTDLKELLRDCGNEEKERQLLLLNSLLADGFDTECDGEVCHFVEVNLTEKVKSTLNQLGKDNQWIEENKLVIDDDIEVIDLCHVAWDYADWFAGDKFIIKK